MDYERALIDLVGKQAERNKLLKERATEIHPMSFGEFALGRLGTAMDVIKARAEEKRKAEAEAAKLEAERQFKQQQFENQARQSLFGTVLKGGGELPEEYMGLPKGYKLPEKPVTPRQITRTVHDPSGFYFITFDPTTGKTEKVKAEGIEGKKLSESALFMLADRKTQDDIHAAEKRYAADLQAWKDTYTAIDKITGRKYTVKGAPPRPRQEAYYELFPSTKKFATRVMSSRGSGADYVVPGGDTGRPDAVVYTEDEE